MNLKLMGIHRSWTKLITFGPSSLSRVMVDMCGSTFASMWKSATRAMENQFSDHVHQIYTMHLDDGID